MLGIEDASLREGGNNCSHGEMGKAAVPQPPFQAPSDGAEKNAAMFA